MGGVGLLPEVPALVWVGQWVGWEQEARDAPPPALTGGLCPEAPPLYLLLLVSGLPLLGAYSLSFCVTDSPSPVKLEPENGWRSSVALEGWFCAGFRLTSQLFLLADELRT